MNKIIKIWNVLLGFMLGILISGCRIDQPPAAEYGPEPEYGLSEINGDHVNIDLTLGRHL